MSKRITFCILLLSFAFTLHVNAQNEFSKWYFATYAGLDFSTSPPTALTNGTMIAPEGCATVSDALGNLLFYTEGSQVFNSAHVVMANGSGLNGDPSSTQAVLVVKKPGSANLYYVFTTDQVVGAYYSVVDMSLAAGMGSVTTKNVLLHASTTEKQVAVRHCNGTDVWILGHENGTDKFWAYQLTSNGVNVNPTISSIGIIPAGNVYASIGNLKVSPNGKLLAAAIHSNSVPSSLGSRGFYLFNFEPASGVVSNSLTLYTFSNTFLPYGVEFSPDGTKLYGTAFSQTVSSGPLLFQWDVCQSSTASIVNSVFSFSVPVSTLAAIQRAVDNKLYITSSGFVGLSVINNPNNSGAAMNFSTSNVSIANKQARYGLPNWINLYTKPPTPPFTSSVTCQTANFKPPSVFSFSDNCSFSNYTYTSFLWDFGEPISGAANSSTLANPSHYFAAVGSYTVKLILYSQCSSDTVSSTINITTLDPIVNITGKTSICKGEQRFLTISGATNYLWDNSATTNTLAISPSLRTVYSVTASTSSCTLIKTFTVDVKDCVGIEEIQIEELKIFPMPFDDHLEIESPEAGIVSIYNLDGKLLAHQEMTIGLNSIDTRGLEPGMYFLKKESAELVKNVLIVKQK